jgi:hypothetical protein
MNQERIITAFASLGKVLQSIGNNEEWQGFGIGLTQEEYLSLDALVCRQKSINGWFTEENVRLSMRSIGNQLTYNALKEWRNAYDSSKGKKRVAVIMAGNIPLVGFHDFLSVLISGHFCVVKLSSDDKQLLPEIAKLIVKFEPELSDYFYFTEGLIGHVDAVIATGSDNSAIYFERYFAKYPHIFRKNRTSVAVLNGTETRDELILLGHDVFDYFGLGCRSISHIVIPSDYDLNRFFEAIVSFEALTRHHKYANNYDYNKAICLLNKVDLLDNNFVLLRETEELFSPLGMLHYHRYDKTSDVLSFLTLHKEKIQIVVGKEFLDFGKAQSPMLTEYSDGLDTMAFLSSI